MSSAKKVILIPAKQENVQIGGGPGDDLNSGVLTSEIIPKNDKIKSKIYDKIHRFIKIILKLAKYVGYDSDLRIKLKNGKYLEKSNIVDLLTHAMSVGRVLYGENEFIELLANSDVDPDLIINENVRSKLFQFKNIKKRIDNDNDNETMDSETGVNYKRKRFEIDDQNEEERVNKKSRNREIDEGNQQMEPDRSSTKKRKLTESVSDLDDDQIDPDRWEIPKDV